MMANLEMDKTLKRDRELFVSLIAVYPIALFIWVCIHYLFLFKNIMLFYFCINWWINISYFAFIISFFPSCFYYFSSFFLCN